MLNHKFFGFNDLVNLSVTSSLFHNKVFVFLWQCPLSLRSFTPRSCWGTRHCCLINYNILMEWNCLIFILHTCSCQWCKPGQRYIWWCVGCHWCQFMCSLTWYCDRYCRCISYCRFAWNSRRCFDFRHRGLWHNFFTWEVFLEYWVPPCDSTTTLLPVLLTTWNGDGSNDVENLSFFSCLTSTWSPTWTSDGLAFMDLSAYALVFALTSASLSRVSKSER